MKKIEFLGRKFGVWNADDQRNAPEGTLYGMVRIADDDPTRIPPALCRRRLKELCEDCGAVCWFDPMSFGSLPGHITRLCLQCVMIRAKAEGKNEIHVQPVQARPANDLPIRFRRD